MRRSAFTLIELLVIVAVIGIMTTGAVLAVASGQKAVRVKGATRDVFAAIRQARSVALVTQKPTIVNYSTVVEDGEPRAVVEIVSAKLMDTQSDRAKVQTITGHPMKDTSSAGHEKQARPSGGKVDGGEDTTGDGEGMSVEDTLFAPVDAEVVRGVRLKVLHGDEYLEARADERPKAKVSVFSNVDYLLGRYKDARAEEKKKSDAAAAESKSEGEATPAEDSGEPVSIVWETNGRVEPHKVWVYPDGARPEDGLCISVDAFGGAKVLSGDGREE